MAKKTPGLNTGSMADISFLLLTFFLLTSSINTDQGIQRRLPPPLAPDQEVPEMNRRNVLQILVNKHDQLLVNGEVLTDVRQLKNRTKEFISNPNNNSSLSEQHSKYIEDLGENIMVSKGVVSLQNDRSTSYSMYVSVQNQLTKAFNELREEYAQQHFGKSFDKLSETQKKGVQKIYPISISEAEPSNYGGNR
ncbi:MAG: biopolymer transporter ExbD [Bacteroidales bacterium]|nr:biopolymer transporter ExbD [Bacteroidales bacterium]MDD4209075.1 biopolymer transporter ExbD [Bacteroidales bacterium]